MFRNLSLAYVSTSNITRGTKRVTEAVMTAVHRQVVGTTVSETEEFGFPEHLALRGALRTRSNFLYELLALIQLKTSGT